MHANNNHVSLSSSPAAIAKRLEECVAEGVLESPDINLSAQRNANIAREVWSHFLRGADRVELRLAGMNFGNGSGTVERTNYMSYSLPYGESKVRLTAHGACYGPNAA